jgi:hypothetical protein
LSFFKRVNTIGFDVESVGGTRRISTLDFIKFLKDDVGVRPADIKSIQRHPIAPYCFLGLHDEETMNGIWTNISSGVQWTNKGEVYPFLCTESYTEVKVKGMIPGTDPLVVSALLYEFGEVLTCKEFKTKIEGAGRSALCDTGDFLLRMRLDEPIPRLLPSGSDGDVWVVYYEGQEDACWKCMKPGHMTRECRSQGTNDFTKEQRAGKLAYRAMNEAMEDDSEAAASGEILPQEVDTVQQAGSIEDSLPLHLTATPFNDSGAASLVVPALQLNSQPVEEVSQDMFAASPNSGVAKEKSELFTPGNTVDLLEAMTNVEKERLGSSSTTVDMETGADTVTFSKGATGTSKADTEKKRNGSSSALPKSPSKRPKHILQKLVATPLGALTDQRRNSGDLNAVKKPSMTPEDRRRLVAQKQK